jgi:hypothetical protein
MKIELSEFVENEDGSANCVLEVDEAAKLYLVNVGFISMLEKAIKEYKLENPIT